MPVVVAAGAKHFNSFEVEHTDLNTTDILAM